jgi:acetylornithine deacetylase/succinyl-diaminopimelate desuccinylase-like protein
MTNETALEKFKEFLRIPSVSTDPAHQADVRRAAEWVRAELQAAGFADARLIEGDGHPLVAAEWLGAPGKPTLLVYAHYDVQPPDPLDEWISPPFEPAIRNDNIYARGAVDDKGQLYLQVRALAELLARDGKLPVNVKILYEGEEEVGGRHIESYVRSHPGLLQADAALVCDTEMFAPGLPTLCVGLRGIVYGEIHVETSRTDLHSGMYGGAAPNAVQAAAEIIAALKDRDGRILIPGLYDDVAAPSPEEAAAWARLPFDEKEYREKEVQSTELVGEPGFDVFHRTWARPTFEVHGIRGGFTGEGAKTVIPARAVVKCSLRLVPNQDPARVAELTAQAVRAAAPRGARAEFKLIHSAPASVVDPNHPLIHKAAEALTEVFGKETVYIRSGGSIPIVGLFRECLGIPSVLMGFGLPDDNLHAPNEKFHVPNFFRGIAAVKRYLEIAGA